MIYPQRGEIYWVNLYPTIGSEIAKTRPAVVISNNIGNQHADRAIVAPVTSANVAKTYPFEMKEELHRAHLFLPGAAGAEDGGRVLVGQDEQH